jgi:hypothetical protein
MSVNPSQTNLAAQDSFFLKQGGATAPTSLNPYASISTITSDHIVLDGVGLDGSSAGGGQLLVNGIALATVNQNVSSIANWATYPALSSIVYSGTGGTGGVINMSVGTFSTINGTTNNLSSLTVTGTTSQTGLVTSVNHTNTGLLSTLGFNVSTINGQRPNFYNGLNVQQGSYVASNDSTQNISVSGLADGLYMFYTAGATTVGKEFVFPFQVYGGTAFAGATVFNFGPSYSTQTDYGVQNSMSAKGNAISSSKTIGIYYQSTINPTETMNYYIEMVGSAYLN